MRITGGRGGGPRSHCWFFSFRAAIAAYVASPVGADGGAGLGDVNNNDAGVGDGFTESSGGAGGVDGGTSGTNVIASRLRSSTVDIGLAGE
jgi:hypothetical protein